MALVDRNFQVTSGETGGTGKGGIFTNVKSWHRAPAKRPFLSDCFIRFKTDYAALLSGLLGSDYAGLTSDVKAFNREQSSQSPYCLMFDPLQSAASTHML